jgi:hypothetical protein
MRGGGNGAQQGRDQEVGELRQRAAEAAARQREIAREVESLARRGRQEGEAGRAARGRLAERKEALADSVAGLEEDIRQTARARGDARPDGARRLGEAAEALRRNRVPERIRESGRSLAENRPEEARAAERDVSRGLGELSERLQAAESAAGRTAGSGAEEALDRTRRLADDLESLRRRLDERAARREAGRQRQGGPRNGQQEGGQQGGQSQGDRQQGGEGSPQGGAEAGASETGGSGDAGDARQLAAELRERLRDAEDMRRGWGTTASTPALNRAVEELRRLADGRMKGDALTAAALKAQVIDPLRQLELELSRRLREQLGRANLRLGDEGAAPERYRKAVEEYYRRLSQGGRR